MFPTTKPSRLTVSTTAINETREDFIATKWEQQPQAKSQGQVMRQVWFAGSHSDIGGGWPERDLADLTLWWMLVRPFGVTGKVGR